MFWGSVVGKFKRLLYSCENLCEDVGENCIEFFFFRYEIVWFSIVIVV